MPPTRGVLGHRSFREHLNNQCTTLPLVEVGQSVWEKARIGSGGGDIDAVPFGAVTQVQQLFFSYRRLRRQSQAERRGPLMADVRTGDPPNEGDVILLHREAHRAAVVQLDGK